MQGIALSAMQHLKDLYWQRWTSLKYPDCQRRLARFFEMPHGWLVHWKKRKLKYNLHASQRGVAHRIPLIEGFYHLLIAEAAHSPEDIVGL